MKDSNSHATDRRDFLKKAAKAAVAAPAVALLVSANVQQVSAQTAPPPYESTPGTPN